jgi:phytoene dehydrogenase-like protein
MPDVDVVIVGGGLAGLACARALAERGISFTLLEADDRLGGRVRTDNIDGYLLDRGFQVFLTSYPTAGELLDLDALELCPFPAGADVFFDGRFHRVADPRRAPLQAARLITSPLATVADVPKVLSLVRRWTRPDAPEREADRPAIDALREAGLSDHLIDRFLRPFFGGVFFDRDLATSARMLAFTFGNFARGRAAVPARGMGAIAEQMAAQLPGGSTHTRHPVASVEPGAVTLESGGRVTARAVVVATESHVAGRLLPQHAERFNTGWRMTATLWYAADEPPHTSAHLLLDGEGRGPINHAAIMTSVAPTYAPGGMSLIGLNVVDQSLVESPELEPRTLDHARRWFGDRVDAFRHLRTDLIPHALPDQRATDAARLEPWRRPTRLDKNLFICGDHRHNASIDGAVASGLACSDELAQSLADTG